jgi:hypothetical protein
VVRRRAILAGLIALGGIWPASSFAADPVRVTAGFDRGAQLGASSAMHAELAIDPRRLPSPVTEVRVLYPKGLGLIASGLALASCARPPSDFEEVLVNVRGLGGCSPNAVLGFGTARAEVRLGDGQVIPETGTLTVLAGPIEQGAVGLVAIVRGEHPFGATLIYGGELAAASRRFGGALVFRVPPIPSIADLATVALVNLRLSIGTSAITYYRRPARRTGAYHPDGITLPSRCPRGGFRFRAQLAFQDGSRAAAGVAVRCPRSPRGR